MSNKSGGVFWRRELLRFLDPHPNFVGTDDKVFVPRKDLAVTLYFEGGFTFEGDASDLQLNFNFDPLIVINQSRGKKDHAIRLGWSRFMGFGLKWESREGGGGRKKPKLFIVPGVKDIPGK